MFQPMESLRLYTVCFTVRLGSIFIKKGWNVINFVSLHRKRGIYLNISYPWLVAVILQYLEVPQGL